jgi:glutathione S-transferase
MESGRSAESSRPAARPETMDHGHRLITIPISHFCEKARWALDRAGIPYSEERHLQGIHIAYARRAGGGRTVPVLVSAGGEVLPESRMIVRWVDGHLDGGERLYPDGAEGAEAARIEAWLDAGLGPDGRLWMYELTLPVIGELTPWIVDGTPRWERSALRWGRRAVDPFIRRYLGVSAENAAAARMRVATVFDEVAGMLRDGRPYLCGDRFTTADLTFAALSGAVLVPEAYGSPLPPLDALPARMADEVKRLRDHEAGAFAARLYAEHRHRVVQPAPTVGRAKPLRPFRA